MQESNVVISWQILAATESLFPYLMMDSEHILKDLWVSGGLLNPFRTPPSGVTETSSGL